LKAPGVKILKRLMTFFGIAVLGLVLLAACSDDTESTSTPTDTPVAAASTEAPDSTEPDATAEPATKEPTATADPEIDEDDDSSEPAMEEPSATAEPAMKDTAMEASHTVDFPLDELGSSGQSGTATLVASGDSTVVTLHLSEGSVETELVHIHNGQCGDALAGVAHVLTNFAGGAGSSVTTIEQSLDSLLTGAFAINAHQTGNPGTYTACGNIPESVSFEIGELNGSGQPGTATLTARGDSTMVTLQLTGGSLETELVHIHNGQCGDTLAGVAHGLTNFAGGAGASVTTVDASLGSLLTGAFAVNAHRVGNPGTYTACGNIPGGSETSAPASKTASIRQFTHPNLTISAGTTVVWTNDDRTTHTVTLGSNGARDGDGFDSGNIGGGGTFEFTFYTPGSFAYTCRIHPSMNGTIEVTQGS
jgi:plastocyanin